MTKTLTNKTLNSGLPSSDSVMIMRIPLTPKTNDAAIKIFVAIRCIVYKLYRTRYCSTRLLQLNMSGILKL